MGKEDQQILEALKSSTIFSRLGGRPESKIKSWVRREIEGLFGVLRSIVGERIDLPDPWLDAS